MERTPTVKEIQFLPEPLSGQDLIEFIKSPKKRRQPIVDGLIYENSVVMFASHPGIGKSMLLLQMCLEISAGLPVFGAFPSRATKIYYIQKERPLDEVAERVEEMQKIIPWNPDNFIIDSSLQTFSLANEKNHEWIIERIIKHSPGIIVIDPIGSGTPGLSKDEPANLFCNFSTALQQRSKATNIFAHHITKDSYTRDGQLIEKDDPFYGSQWLKAHVTGSYLIEETEAGRTFINKKSSHSNLIKQFDISYDSETMLSTTSFDSLTLTTKAKQYCNAVKKSGILFTEKQFRDFLGCAPTSSRELLRTPPLDEKTGLLKRHKTKGHATLYEVLEYL